jgi:hypothetical protein
MVITKDMSRLGRDYIETGHYTERYFPDNGVRYIALHDGIDTGVESTMNDMTPFKAVINDQWARDTSRKVRSVKHAKRDNGLFIGWKAPFGYTVKKNVFEIDGEAAEVVRYIFKLAVEGVSCRKIAEKLNDEKIPTPATQKKINLTRIGPHSGLWSSESICRTLKNEMYIGNMVQGITRKPSYKSKKCVRVPKEDWVIVPNTHEPIVSKEIFDKAGLIVASRKHTRQRTHDYLLRGLIHCRECGYPLGVIMRMLAGNRETLYFLCRTYQRFTKADICTSHSIRVETVTDAVLSEVRKICKQYIERLNLTELTAEANKKLLDEKKRQQKCKADIKTNLERLECKIDKIYNDKLDDNITEDDFQRIYKKLKDEQASLHSKAQSLAENGDEDLYNEPKIKELVRRFLNADEISKELLVSLIERVELTKDKEIFIHFRFNVI